MTAPPITFATAPRPDPALARRLEATLRLLRLCAGSGDLPQVEQAMMAGADIAADDGSGHDAPLRHALARGDDRLVRYLLREGADPRLEDPDGSPDWPLRWAVIHGHADLVAALLASGANPRVHDACGSDACLRIAAERGHVALVRQFLELGCAPDAPDGNGPNCPIRWASRFGRAEVVALLADCGVDLQEALSHAATGRHAATLRVLLDRGARINMSDASDLVTSAVIANDAGLLTQIRQRMGVDWDGGSFAMDILICEERLELLDHVFRLGFDVSLHGYAALCGACKHGLVPVVRRLLQAGAPLVDRNGMQTTDGPLACVLEARRLALIGDLLRAGVDPTMVPADDAQLLRTYQAWLAKHVRGRPGGLAQVACLAIGNDERFISTAPGFASWALVVGLTGNPPADTPAQQP